MGVLVKALQDATGRTIDRVASEIEGEMKSEFGRHSKSGAMIGAIHIERTGEFSRFVGGTGGEGTKHLYWINEGNGSGGIPKNPPPKAPMPLTYGNKEPRGFAMRVSNYPGKHYIEKIAARHGG